MFLNKVHDQKVELMRAVFRNMYLKEKCDYLDSECKMLAERIISSQVTEAERNETNVTLLKELHNLKQLREQRMHELCSAKERIVSLSLLLENSKSSEVKSLSESKSVNEDLGIKNDMIKCLQEELVHVRLEAAEKWASIRDLQRMKNELEKDKDMLVKAKPDTISRLQEELMTAKILQTEYSLEFEKIKQHLQRMKTEFQSYVENAVAGKSEGTIKLSGRIVSWKSRDKSEENKIIEQIQKLEDEKLYIQSKIPELHGKIETLNKQIQFKDAERSELQNKLDNMKMKYQSTENIILERQRQWSHLENTASEKVFTIRNCSTEKKQNIDDLSDKLQEMSQRQYSNSPNVTARELKTIQGLEDQLMALKDKINQLQNETTQLRSGDSRVSNRLRTISN